MKRSLPILLLLIAMVLFPYGVNRVFYGTGLEREMGTAQKIFYFHVPMAWITMLFAVICGVAAARQLRRPHAQPKRAYGCAYGAASAPLS